jgi:lipopolysaccharide export system permease protein
MLKRLDKLMAKSFAGPFIVTFAIALFVLMMQVLWLYLDDIAGKGLGFFTVIELMSYKCVGLVPLALPLALLISSVMVLGGMAEHYELSSFKSAGTSLLRVMRLLIVFGVLSAALSFAVADYVIPAANLQFGARMYDIQQKKPTFNMEPGVFNEDFDQYAIRLGSRADNGRDIGNVLIYDHTKAATGELGQITAETGEMYTTPDGLAFVMKLKNGVQYAEQRPGGSSETSRPFVRTAFNSYTKVFDLSEFKLNETNKSLFSTNRSMLATWQLQVAVDSINDDIAVRKQSVSNHLINYLPLLAKDTIVYRVKNKVEQKEEEEENRTTRPGLDNIEAEETDTENADSTTTKGMTGTYQPTGGGTLIREIRKPANRQLQAIPQPLDDSLVPIPAKIDTNNRINEAYARAMDHPGVRALSDWQGIDSTYAMMTDVVQKRIANRTRSATRAITGQAKAASRILPGIQESRVKHIYDLHMKYSMALVCIIFIFIGAPMGAIVRKGGFGLPILVSIIFFVIFIILTIFCRKLAESFVVDAAFAGWLPCIILFPVSLYITSRAIKDAKLLSTDGISRLLLKAKERFGKKAPGDKKPDPVVD